MFSQSNQSAIPRDLVVSEELLLKYDKPGPRYTSYPTAPEWHDHFRDNDYRLALSSAAEQDDRPLSVYVHIPFCWERCLFCGCNVVISKRQDVADKYLDYVEKELAMGASLLRQRNKIKQLHWGGGTPTYLTVSQIEFLYHAISRHFDIESDAEIALEVDPRVTTSEQLETLRNLGFNRISMGVQDLEPSVQETINRNQTETETRTMYTQCRDLGFSGINMDLIYGLPGQNLIGWERTIDATIDMRPDRLAVYSYAHLPNAIKHQRRLESKPRPNASEKLMLFSLARRKFLEAGYRAIGMDHFALPTDELALAMDERRLHRNFMGYTVVPAADMAGFGVSSISEIGGAYAQNEKRPVMYYKMLDNNQFPTHCGVKLSDDDLIRRWLIRQLMCNFYLDINELNDQFNISYDDYFSIEEKELITYYEEGLLVRNNDCLTVQPLGQVFIRNICMTFDKYLRQKEHFNKFSRTV